MAKVIITIEDTQDGTIGYKTEYCDSSDKESKSNYLAHVLNISVERFVIEVFGGDVHDIQKH
ncbi:hypothetical protein [Neisseria sp. Ec49-e6-T10]|uniref:hypothetical protein n=1 Tax=Neisseria sp. Ec49-e6-T10 TaxID=3140744 RepID=UPI003EBDAC25